MQIGIVALSIADILDIYAFIDTEKLIMCFYPIKVKGRYVACQKCLECRINKSNEWAMRVSLEASLYSSNCVLTLTYDNEHLPEGGFLSKRDLQLFIKRLRKHVGALRYFACGEYGSLKGRPHFHVIVFGYCPDDLVFLKRDRKGTMLFNSSFISRLWSKGFISVCNEVSPYTARYCAKYFQKRNGGAFKPFLLMSRKPGIGLPGYKEAWAYTDKLYICGKTIRLPRYFIDKTEDVSAVADLKQRRLSRLSPFHFPDHDEYFCFDRDRYLSYCDQRRIDFFDKFPFFRHET